MKRRSKPIVVEGFELIDLPQSEPATWPGNTSTPSGELEQPVERVEEPLGAFARADREVGARGVADEQRVAGEHEPRLSARELSITVRQQCSGRWPGVWITPSATSPTSISSPSSHRIVRVVDLGGRVDADRDAVLEREAAVPGDVVGVRVRLDRAHDPDAAPLGLGEDRLDREGGSTTTAIPGLLVSDEVTRTAEIVVQELVKITGRR